MQTISYFCQHHNGTGASGLGPHERCHDSRTGTRTFEDKLEVDKHAGSIMAECGRPAGGVRRQHHICGGVSCATIGQRHGTKSQHDLPKWQNRWGREVFQRLECWKNHMFEQLSAQIPRQVDNMMSSTEDSYDMRRNVQVLVRSLWRPSNTRAF